MKVLVTGNEGYVGSVLYKMLENQNFSVKGFDIGYFPYSLEKLESDQIKADIRNIQENDLKDIDAICHLAALSNDPLGELDQNLTYDINFNSTVNLAKIAKKAGVKFFIFSSSCSSYGANSEIVNETSELLPQTAYAKSKILSEQELLKLKDDHFSPVNLRSATAYGLSPNLRLDLVVNNLTASAVATGKVNLLSDGSAWRPLVHVEDMANAFVTVLKNKSEKVSGEVFNVGGNADNYSVKEIAEIVESIVPNSKISFSQNANKDSRSYKVNFDKIHSELGFTPKRKLTDSILELYQTFTKIGLDEKSFEDKIFYRVKYIKWLMDQKIINSKLQFL